MNYENCMKCGTKLKRASRVRTKPKKCHKCLGKTNEYSHNYDLSTFCKKIIEEAQRSKIETEDHTHKFDDDPAAEDYNENEVGKINKQSLGIVFTTTSLGDIGDEN